MTFRNEEIARLASSGWARCPSVAEAVIHAGLPRVTTRYLEGAFSAKQWAEAEEAVSMLAQHFAGARFADEATYGVVLVPSPKKLDTRRPMGAHVRRDQLGRATADVFDSRLPAGVLGLTPDPDWTLVATITGPYGLALGSYDDISRAPRSAFMVKGRDTRTLMIRQVWGARVLQSGAELPDSERNEHWTFTLFPGEKLVDGCAESGTVLKGKVRFRLGKSGRGIGPARVSPALDII